MRCHFLKTISYIELTLGPNLLEPGKCPLFLLDARQKRKEKIKMKNEKKEGIDIECKPGQQP